MLKHERTKLFMTNKRLSELKKISLNAKLLALEGIFNAQSGHPGGSLSATDIMTYLYFEKMKIDPKNPKMNTRDRFVLSKGHAGPSLYALLALKGFFDTSELKNLRKLGCMLQGHPCMNEIPGIDMSTGSLGQGFSEKYDSKVIIYNYENQQYKETCIGSSPRSVRICRMY